MLKIYVADFTADFDDRRYKSLLRDRPSKQPPELYEGNFDEWFGEAEAMLLSQDHLTMPLATASPELDTSARAAWCAEGKEAARLLKRSIRPEILIRIPHELQNNVHDLVPALSEVAAPFCIMDLPPELRLLIFELALQSEDTITLISTSTVAEQDGGDKSRVTNPPPLTVASRMLRAEALPIYYAVNTFEMELNHLSGNDLAQLSIPEVEVWADGNPIAAKHLRQLAVVAQPNDFWIFGSDAHLPPKLTVRYRAGYGVDVDFSISMKKPSLTATQYDRLV
ncbi:hypothetical protein LTR36_001660 [Oleoguttula mirabilis]|uniref:2EXR domain-containing protein n=1 Tax=Oleoguttula mirabilis TaxID=1507867 RepID=A0AAV9JQW1_9PEZI|nr:hypothetical protein LTR36_001660 [Oleoguttula mirabilis]